MLQVDPETDFASPTNWGPYYLQHTDGFVSNWSTYPGTKTPYPYSTDLIVETNAFAGVYHTFQIRE